MVRVFGVMSSRSGLVGGQGSLEVMFLRSLLISCHVFLEQPARLSSCWEGRKPELAGWLGAYSPDSGPGVHLLPQ